MAEYSQEDVKEQTESLVDIKINIPKSDKSIGTNESNEIIMSANRAFEKMVRSPRKEKQSWESI